MHQVIKDFQHTIESNPEVLQLMKNMFEEVPHDPRFAQDPLGQPAVQNYHELLEIFDKSITKAPEWNGTNPGVKHLPFSALLNWPLSTASGRACFRNARVNACIRAVFSAWADFLDSPQSCYVLSDSSSGWFSASAQAFLMCDTTDHRNRRFADEFLSDNNNNNNNNLVDPHAPWKSFQSWNSFFTRAFRPGVRPVAAPHDQNVIVNACEAAPFRLATDVQSHNTFWLKEQPYSLQDMFAGHPLAANFAGSTVYQGFLSAGSYHRWHSPVAGRVVSVHMQPGLYFAKPERGYTTTTNNNTTASSSSAASTSGPSSSSSSSSSFDPTDPVESQAYIAQVSSRALIFIQADNPRIGLMCVMPVGWVEASTCSVTVREQQRVAKGEQLGMFRFGGSTHCLVFRKGVRLRWHLRGQRPGLETKVMPVNSALAYVEEEPRSGLPKL